MAEGEFLANTFVFHYEETIQPLIKWFFNGHSDEYSYNFAFGNLQLLHPEAYTAAMTLYNPTVLEEGFVEGQLLISALKKLLSSCSGSSSAYFDLVNTLTMLTLTLEAAVIQIKRYGKHKHTCSMGSLSSFLKFYYFSESIDH